MRKKHIIKKILLNLKTMIIVLLFVLFLLAIIDINQPAFSTDWPQNTEGWFEWHYGDAPSILIDSYFHRSFERALWWAADSPITPGNSLDISRYIEVYTPNRIWGSWSEDGWMLSVSQNSTINNVTVGVGDEGEDGDKEEFCKINIVGTPSLQNELILTQSGFLLDARNYQLCITTKSTSTNGIISIFIIDNISNQVLFSVENLSLQTENFHTEEFTPFSINNNYPNCRIELHLGLAAGVSGGTVWLDEVSLVPLDTDISFAPEAPAGNKGFLQIDPNGKYYFPDTYEKKERFFGTSLNIAHPFPEYPPTHRDSEILAKRLASQGYNIARIQGIEPTIITPYVSTTVIDEDRLDRLDYLIAKLKDYGLYVILETMGSRAYRVGDEINDEHIPEVDESRFAFHNKASMQNMFDEQHILGLKDYIEDLFVHNNIYTNSSYLNDAGIQWILIANEFQLIDRWRNQRLNGPKFYAPSFNNCVIPLRYSYQLDQKWNDWLFVKYQGNRETLKAAWGEGGSNAQLQIPGVELVWDPDFELSSQVGNELVWRNNFTYGSGSNTVYGETWGNDFWAYSGHTDEGYNNFLVIQSVEVTSELGENPPPGISNAIKFALINNTSGVIHQACLWPTSCWGVGSYRYSNNSVIHDYQQNKPLSLEANKQYIVTFWAKKDIAMVADPEDYFKNLRLEVRDYDTQQAFAFRDFNVSSDWQRFAIGFTPEVDSLNAQLIFKLGGKGNGDLYITGINLIQCGHNATQDFSFNSSISSGLWNYNLGTGATAALVTQGSEPLDDSSLKIVVPAGQEAVVSQGGIDIRSDHGYTLGFYLKKTSNTAGSINVAMETETGQPIMNTSIYSLAASGTQQGWHYYWIPFKALNTGTSSSLKFSFSGENTFYLDHVKLIGSNQITNGDFYSDEELGENGWNFYGETTAQASIVGTGEDRYCNIIKSSLTIPVNLKDGVLPQSKPKQELDQIAVSNVIRLEQSGVSLEKGRTYTIRIKARSDQAGSISAKILSQNNSILYTADLSFELTTDWKEFSASLGPITDELLDTKIVFYFNFGQTTDEIDITRISLEDEGELEGLYPDETFFNPLVWYINFQPSSIDPVTGYQADGGQGYQVGSYGWVGNLPTQFTSRTTPVQYVPSKESTAVIVLNQSGGWHWKIDLPDGKYFVTASCGDPNSTGGIVVTHNYLKIEGNEVFNGMESAAVDNSNSSSYFTNAKYVFEVEADTGENGELDIIIGDSNTGGYTALRYLIIKQAKNENGFYSIQRPLLDYLPILSKNKVNDIVKFYKETEKSFYDEIEDYLKYDLEASQQIISTQNYWGGLPGLENQASYGTTSTNPYWGLTAFTNTPMIKYQEKFISWWNNTEFSWTPLIDIFLSSIKNQPLLTTEFNSAFPNYFRAEALAMQQPYSAFQDKDDILINFFDWHTYEDRLTVVDTKNSPTMRGMDPVISRMIMRRDVSPSQNNLELTYTQQEVMESLARYGAEKRFCVKEGLPLEFGLVTGLSRADFNAPYSKTAQDYTINSQSIDDFIEQYFPDGVNNQYQGWFVSDTEQLKWNNTDGIFTLNTANTQIIIGFLDEAIKVQEASAHLDNLAIDGCVTTTEGAIGIVEGSLQTVDPNLGFANVSLTSLTNEPIAISSRLLLNTLAREANTDQSWTSSWSLNTSTQVWSPPTNLVNIGHPPVLAETVRTKVKIIVNSIPGYPAVKVWKLNPFGQRLEEVENVTFDGSQITIDLNAEYQNPDAKKTIWYLIERTQQPTAPKGER